MKYTDTGLLNILLPMLHFYTKTDRDHPDIVEFQILKGPICYCRKEFITAVQKKINELTKMADVRVTDTNTDDSSSSEIRVTDTNTDDSSSSEIYENYGDCEEQTYSSKEYYDLKTECIEKDHEIYKLRRTVEALEYLIYNCIPKDDRRKD